MGDLKIRSVKEKITKEEICIKRVIGRSCQNNLFTLTVEDQTGSQYWIGPYPVTELHKFPPGLKISLTRKENDIIDAEIIQEETEEEVSFSGKYFWICKHQKPYARGDLIFNPGDDPNVKMENIFCMHTQQHPHCNPINVKVFRPTTDWGPRRVYGLEKFFSRIPLGLSVD